MEGLGKSGTWERREGRVERGRRRGDRPWNVITSFLIKEPGGEFEDAALLAVVEELG